METPADTTAQPDVLPEDAVTPDAAQQDAFALQIESVDSETAVILAEQMKVQQQGYALDQYHRINILGDSLTEGVGARTPDKAFPAVLAKLTGAKVNNYGVSGSRITDIVVDYTNPGSFVDRMYSMDKAADLVIVFGGTNDFWFGDCPIGKRTDSKPNTFYGALNTMIPYLKNAYAADLVLSCRISRARTLMRLIPISAVPMGIMALAHSTSTASQCWTDVSTMVFRC